MVGYIESVDSFRSTFSIRLYVSHCAKARVRETYRERFCGYNLDIPIRRVRLNRLPARHKPSGHCLISTKSGWPLQVRQHTDHYTIVSVRLRGSGQSVLTISQAISCYRHQNILRRGALETHHIPLDRISALIRPNPFSPFYPITPTQRSGSHTHSSIIRPPLPTLCRLTLCFPLLLGTRLGRDCLRLASALSLSCPLFRDTT